MLLGICIKSNVTELCVGLRELMAVIVTLDELEEDVKFYYKRYHVN